MSTRSRARTKRPRPGRHSKSHSKHSHPPRPNPSLTPAHPSTDRSTASPSASPSRILPFRLSYVSSETSTNPASNLLTFSSSSPGWSSSKYSTSPQILILGFPALVRLTQLKLVSHEFKITKRIELFIGTPRTPLSLITTTDSESTPSFRNCSFRRLGHASLSRNKESGYRARELKIVRLGSGVEGIFLKIVLGECYLNKRNLYSQVGLGAIQCVGMIKRWLPGEGGSGGEGGAKAGVVDSVALRDSIGMGPEEEEFEAEVRELVFYKDQAARAENFLLAASYKKQIEHLQRNREEIRKLQDEKKIAVQDEDYLRADAIRKQLERLRDPDWKQKRKMENGQDQDRDRDRGRGRDRDRFRDSMDERDDEDDISEDEFVRRRLRRSEAEAEAELVSEEEDMAADSGRENLTATTRVFHPGEADARIHHSLIRSVDEMMPGDGEDEDIDAEDGHGRLRGDPDSFVVRNPTTSALGHGRGQHRDDLFGTDDPSSGGAGPTGPEDRDFVQPRGRGRGRSPPSPEEENKYVLYDDRPIVPVRNPDTFYEEIARKEGGEGSGLGSGAPIDVSASQRVADGPPDANLHVDFSEMSAWQQKMATVALEKLRESECPPVQSLGKLSLSVDTSLVMPLFGEFMTKCLYSSTSHHLRIAASYAAAQFIREIDDVAHQTVFVSVMSFLGRFGLKDRIHQVFLNNLDLLEAVLDFATESKQAVVHSRTLPVLDQLILRLGDNSRPKRIQSRRVLFSLCQHPSLGPAYVISRLLRVPKKRGRSRGSVTASNRELVAKVEAVRDFVVEYGFGEVTTLTCAKLMSWLSPEYLAHTRNEIRSVAAEVMVLAYKHFETEYLAQGSLKGVPQKVFFSRFCRGIESAPLRKEMLKRLGFEFEEIDRRGIPPIQELPRNQPGRGGEAERGGQKKRRRRKKHEFDEFFFWTGRTGLMYGPKQAGECPFCRGSLPQGEGEEEGEEDPEAHYLQDCPMISQCPLCDFVIPIPHFDHHLVYSCPQRKNVECCPTCKVPQLKPELSTHIESTSCEARKPLSEANRCYLCHEDIPPGVDGWRKHLMEDYCPSNIRTVDKTELELGADTSKKELTSRMLEV